MNGRFIAFEGIDGCGKTTQMRFCAEKLRASGYKVVTLREPGSTAIGENIRDLLLTHTSDISPRTELFLFMACRAQFCAEAVKPALESGAIVLSDRFLWSSAAYQGGGSHLGIESVLSVGNYATFGIEPHLYVVIDIPPAVALSRAKSAPDRIEKRSSSYFDDVRNAYKGLVDSHSDISVMIDGCAPEQGVFEQVWQEVIFVVEHGKRSRRAD